MLDDVVTDLKSDEGWRPTVYKDHLGFDTVGFGFLIDAKKGGGLPKPVAEFWLRYLLNEKQDQLRKRWPSFDSQPTDVQRGLLNMAYQLGVDGLLNFSRMLTALARGDRSAAALHALDSEWARQTPARARRVATLIRGGV